MASALRDHRGVIDPRGIVNPQRVDELLSSGRTLPAVFYTDATIARLEDQLIFRRAWQLAGSVVELANPGDYVTLRISTVPIVVVRGKDEQIRAFVNVCRHRAQTIVTGEGSCANLQCGYHGWTYGLDGHLTGVPAWRTADLPPFEELGLTPIPVEVWAGLVFVAIEPECSLVDQLGDLPRVMRETGYDFPFETVRGISYLGSYDYTIKANWKVYQENSSECYHCPTSHPGTFGELFDFTRVHLDAVSFNDGGGSFGPFPLRPEIRDRFPVTKAGSQYGYAQYYLWPNTLIVSGFVGEALFRMEPVTAGSMRQTGRGYSRPDAINAELSQLIDVTFAQTTSEDIAIVERVQEGLESGMYESGPTAADREILLRDFHGRVWSSLRPAFD